ncbi:uncharacterized protein MICPUCDRAFT_54107 [Micromonas pusilla CCMP1545]|uniref:Predicted protein n=1 Tax=Micromonas pusilla (strain CCMP1545) TaxID=564608 RepID=C1N8J3_MICPC|nr:uncharacterized protein MICPUCDRAFT_54107 [Micromonas pusilla CCMP1545]EEH51898.1 predicted protein [Micromonas pusilla CCMP1545]|eukprot:XP_003064276.1 predicted protein [Micromonas pusilla CCMP1545]
MVASSSRPHAASASVSAAPPTHLSTFPPPSSAAVASRLAGGQRLSRDLRDAIEARWRHDAAATDEFARVFSETAARHGASSEARHRSSAQQPSSPTPPPPTPRARVDARASSSSSSSSSSPSSRPMATTPSHRKLRERLDACDVSGVDAASIDWSALASVISSEAVAALGARGRGEAEGDGDDDADARVAFEVNSGGAVFFCIFSSPPPPSSEPAPEPATERVLVVKFCSDRLAAQSEYFAHEIASALGVDVPETRLFRRKPAAAAAAAAANKESDARASSFDEWSAMTRAAERAVAEWRDDADAADADARDAAGRMLGCLRAQHAALVMRFVRGGGLFSTTRSRSPKGKVLKERRAPRERGRMGSSLNANADDAGDESSDRPLRPFDTPARSAAAAEALGRVFVLDVLLGNADRMKCERLAWRGAFYTLVPHTTASAW